MGFVRHLPRTFSGERPAADRRRQADVVGLAAGALVGTAVLTAIMEGAQARRLTRMSLPYLLGTMLTERRALIRIAGTLTHFCIGALFAAGYGLLFQRAGRAGWRLGSAVGALHGGVVLVAMIPIVQEVHPRMAEEDEGPDPTPMLQPPGFLGMHYGVQTPVITMLAHVVYGGIVGALYRPTPAKRTQL